MSQKPAVAVLAAALLGFYGPFATPLLAAGDPDFGPNVLVFDPATPNIQETISAIGKKQDAAEFGPGRFAYLFKPGKYSLTIQVGFYMQVAGLGMSPDDVSIAGDLYSTADWKKGNATCNFWRAVENLAINPNKAKGTVGWAVSQGTAVRRLHVQGNLRLFDGGWSSGGFLADSKVDGNVVPGSQQQWLSRNSDFNAWKGGVWNIVFVGCPHAPADAWPKPPYTTVAETPVIREKPFLCLSSSGEYQVMVPELSTKSVGTTWGKGAGGPSAGKAIPIDQFYIAHDKDTAATMNAALAAGKNLLLTPGTYHLEDAIKVTRADTVVYGLGYPTLNPEKGTPAITVADVDGVKICGILLEAGAVESPTLLQVGETGATASHAADPTSLYDIFARAGGAVPGSATAFVTINSNNVIGDNFWLWRADHGAGAGWNSNKNKNGLIVNGNDVTCYGLFVEHSQEYQTLWNGERGRTYFYQSEMPYDPPDTTVWAHSSTKGFASYKVADNVKSHEAWGLGIYTVFKTPIVGDTAIEIPTAPGVQIHHMVCVRLGKGGLNHVLNATGAASMGGPKAVLNLN